MNKPYVLRGWKHKTCALVNLKDCTSKAVDRTGFELLLLCDGETELDGYLRQHAMKARMDEYVKKGIIRICEHAEPIHRLQQYRKYDNCLMESIQWSVTGRCNYKCRHCYMDAPDACTEDLITKQCFSIIDQMAECGVMRVSLTGGEPLIRRDLMQIIDHLNEKRILTDIIYTNGWLVTDELLDALEQRGLKPTFNMSYDGLGCHDWMRGVSGAENAVRDAIRRCVSHGFPINISVCLHKGNQAVLRDTVSYLASAGVNSIKISGVDRTALWRKNAEDNDMDIREYMDAVLAYIPYFFMDGMPVDLMLCSAVQLYKGKTEYDCIPCRCDGTDKADKVHLCGAFRSEGYIAPDGRMVPCMPMLDSDQLDGFPNILETGLKAALSDSFYMDYISSRISDLMEHNAECRDCPYVRKCCAGCRANALLGPDHDLWAPDRNLCILWKEGYVDRIMQVTEQAIRDYVK
ncbi:MAG: radical SAM protein [Clostridia bacterium]|nr:radical SAM protein [Clostridia bacterium]